LGCTAQKIQRHFTSEKCMQCTKAEEDALKNKQTNGIELVINLSSCLKSAVANWRTNKRVSQTKFNNLSKCINLEIFLRGQLSTLY